MAITELRISTRTTVDGHPYDAAASPATSTPTISAQWARAVFATAISARNREEMRQGRGRDGEIKWSDRTIAKRRAQKTTPFCVTGRLLNEKNWRRSVRAYGRDIVITVYPDVRTEAEYVTYRSPGSKRIGRFRIEVPGLNYAFSLENGWTDEYISDLDTETPDDGLTPGTVRLKHPALHYIGLGDEVAEELVRSTIEPVFVEVLDAGASAAVGGTPDAHRVAVAQAVAAQRAAEMAAAVRTREVHVTQGPREESNVSRMVRTYGSTFARRLAQFCDAVNQKIDGKKAVDDRAMLAEFRRLFPPDDWLSVSSGAYTRRGAMRLAVDVLYRYGFSAHFDERRRAYVWRRTEHVTSSTDFSGMIGGDR